NSIARGGQNSLSVPFPMRTGAVSFSEITVMAPNTNISMCVTSCGRSDLLQTTLESFYAIVDQEPQEVLIYEDSDAPKPEFLSSDIWRSRNVRWISGKTRMGQCFAIARLIQEAKHDYVFWCEEDWLFQNQISPFMRESKRLLDKWPNCVMVSLRGPSGWHPLQEAHLYQYVGGAGGLVE